MDSHFKVLSYFSQKRYKGQYGWIGIRSFCNLHALTELEQILSHNLMRMCKSRGWYDEAIHDFNLIMQPFFCSLHSLTKL